MWTMLKGKCTFQMAMKYLNVIEDLGSNTQHAHTYIVFW